MYLRISPSTHSQIELGSSDALCPKLSSAILSVSMFDCVLRFMFMTILGVGKEL